MRSHRRRSEHGHFRERWRYGRRGPRPWNPRSSRNQWRGYRFLRYWLAFPNCLPARHQNPSILEQHRAMAAAGRIHRVRGVERAIDAENFCTCEQAVCAFTAGDKNPPIRKRNGRPLASFCHGSCRGPRAAGHLRQEALQQQGQTKNCRRGISKNLVVVARDILNPPGSALVLSSRRKSG